MDTIQFRHIVTRLLFGIVLTGILTYTATAQTTVILNQPNTGGEHRASQSIILADGFSSADGFHAYIDAAADCRPLAGNFNNNMNYIITNIIRIPGVPDAAHIPNKNSCEVNQTVQYFDGLGRPLQTIQINGNPDASKDIIQPFAYDNRGREVYKYLPYADNNSSNGSYRSNALLSGQGVFNFYNPAGSSGSQLPDGIARIPNPLAETVFEAGPLNRVLQQGAPGADWQTSSGHTIKIEYGTNTENEVRYWKVTSGGASSEAHYDSNQLYKTIIKDENWKPSDGKAGITEEFKDKQGKVILKRVWETSAKSLSTYYVYDNADNLCYVLPPAVNEYGMFATTSFSDSNPIFNDFIYGYRYDGRKRLVEKKVPGKGWEYLIYNKLDQIILTQDANQRNAGQWLFTKYDAFERVVLTGLYNNNISRSSLQSKADSSETLWEQRDNLDNNGTATGYSNSAFPVSNIGEYLSINYYDDYNFYSNAFGQPNGGTQVSSERTKGLSTGSRIKILGSGVMPLTVNYYDKEGRVVQCKAENQLGGTDITDNTWSFPGELLASTRTHTVNGVTTTIAVHYQYDHMGRKKETYEKINNGGEVLLSALTYNEIGQLKEKKLHNGTQTTAYTYNERGWLSSSTSNEFSEVLKYNEGMAPQYNGNIASQQWGAGPTLPNTFSYSYDKLNRLISGSSTGITMSEELTYDDMGNIRSLNRDGTGANIYNYAGNHLLSVNNVTGPYLYDANGNATTDGQNGMGLNYNILNLPQTAFKSGVSVSYSYDAAGRKLSKTSTVNGNTANRYYVNGIEYNGSTIDIIHTEEGVARNNGGTYSYEYNLTDHLGNIRYSFYHNPNIGNLERIQADDYYPFGKRRVVYAGSNKYLYNGKEVQEELEEQYDYGARYYDPLIGRWNVADRLAEVMVNWSSYNYCFNNPVNFVDPLGLAPGSPGSGEHWSDEFRSVEGNAALMSQRTFDSFYNINDDQDRTNMAREIGTTIYQAGSSPYDFGELSFSGNRVRYSFLYPDDDAYSGVGGGFNDVSLKTFINQRVRIFGSTVSSQNALSYGNSNNFIGKYILEYKYTQYEGTVNEEKKGIFNLNTTRRNAELSHDVSVDIGKFSYSMGLTSRSVSINGYSLYADSSIGGGITFGTSYTNSENHIHGSEYNINPYKVIPAVALFLYSTAPYWGPVLAF